MASSHVGSYVSPPYLAASPGIAAVTVTPPLDGNVDGNVDGGGELEMKFEIIRQEGQLLWATNQWRFVRTDGGGAWHEENCTGYKKADGELIFNETDATTPVVGSVGQFVLTPSSLGGFDVVYNGKSAGISFVTSLRLVEAF